MATTSKPRKNKKIVKKTSKKVSVKPNEKEVLGILEHQDLRQLENLSKDVLNCKLDMNLEEQSQKNMTLEMLLMQQKIEKQRELVVIKSERFEAKKRQYQDFKKEISPKYGLAEDEVLGYNPDTGEIVR